MRVGTTEAHAEGGRGESDHGDAKGAAGTETLDSDNPRDVEKNIEWKEQRGDVVELIAFESKAFYDNRDVSSILRGRGEDFQELTLEPKDFGVPNVRAVEPRHQNQKQDSRQQENIKLAKRPLLMLTGEAG